jgi:hypothetical protein
MSVSAQSLPRNHLNLLGQPGSVNAAGFLASRVSARIRSIFTATAISHPRCSPALKMPPGSRRLKSANEASHELLGD